MQGNTRGRRNEEIEISEQEGTKELEQASSNIVACKTSETNCACTVRYNLLGLEAKPL